MSDDIDRFVDQIVDKVQARLGTGGAAAVPAAGCQDACQGCGHCVSKREAQVIDLATAGAARFGSAAGVARPREDIARMIDHTLLKQDATTQQLKQVCDEAKQYGFATVCVNSASIPFVARQLQGSNVKPIAVVGFPLGAMLTPSKAFEAREAVRQGAREIDMVINIGALKSTDYQIVLDDIAAVVAAAKPYPVKVILETGALTLEEKIAACVLSKAGGAAFVKTSTGFGPGGATAEDVALMRRLVGPDMGVKASGGVRSTTDAEAMRAAGASRIGASASVAIVMGKKSDSKY
ncbi:MAG: deoxyribose-phosphate aldolase [Deltaproteobacteria bacterium]|nr:deoxyribose-phosphate aldolase [Deltaproteobacteria bacterium]